MAGGDERAPEGRRAVPRTRGASGVARRHRARDARRSSRGLRDATAAAAAGRGVARRVAAPPPHPPGAPVIESPPIEPVSPPPAPEPATDAARRLLLRRRASRWRSRLRRPPAEPTDEQQLASLLADLQRYGALNADDLRREQNAVTQLLARQRTDYNRIRLAVLYTLSKTSPQDDQRALQLLRHRREEQSRARRR